ncbi:hypothetical protein EI555_019048 [Monodon monoceros]|uniref:Rab-GAP TBC domain-containing protein n=1 Tax=Monodon monoceros TaxID=40151 RepID=A0A4U1ENT9_MONMO|nr:hypothetical protein EI555_019048 [Monodon monoceros]
MEKLETLLALERAEITAKHKGAAYPQHISGCSTHSARQKAQEIGRADKWVKMLRDWSKYRGGEKLASLPEMRRRVYKGIPPQVRGQVWSLLLDMEKVKSPKPQARLYSQDLKQIDLGGNRAFRNRIMFRERYGIKWVPGAPRGEATFPRGTPAERTPRAAHSGVLGQPPGLVLSQVRPPKPDLTAGPPDCAGPHRPPRLIWERGPRTAPRASGSGLLWCWRLACSGALQPTGHLRGPLQGSVSSARREPIQELRGGHCQGMSQVMAILLTFLGEEDAFWALVQLMTDEKHAMHAKGTGSPCCPLGPRATALNPGLVQATLPSLLVLLLHTCHPPVPSEPTARQSPGGSNTPSCAPSLAAKPRRGPGTPPSPTPASARAGRLPTPQPRVPAELGLREQGLCPSRPGLRLSCLGRACPARAQEGPARWARVTAGAGGQWRVLTLCWDHHRALLKLPLLDLLSPQTPFALTLKLWDAYILESKHMPMAMVYTVLKVPERGVQAAEAGWPAQEPRGRSPEHVLGSGPAHGSPGHSRPAGVVPSGTQPPPTGEHLLKLPLEGLQEFLQEMLSRAWALEDDAVLRQLQASMVELRRTKWDLLPSGALSSSLLRSHPLGHIKTLPGEDGLALPGPPAQHEQPGPSPGPAILKAKEQWHEGATAAGLPLGTPEAPSLACLSPAQDSPQDRLQPHLSVNHEATGKWPPDNGFEPECWVLSPSTPAWATRRAARQARPCKPTEVPATGSAQPTEDGTSRPTTPLLPCGNCSQHPSWGSDQHGRDGAGAVPQEQAPRVPTTPNLCVHKGAGHSGVSREQGDCEHSDPEALGSQ